MTSKLFTACVAVVFCSAMTHSALGATDFTLRKGADSKGTGVVGTSQFTLRSGGVKATFKTPSVFAVQALRLTGPQRGLGVKGKPGDPRPHFINQGIDRDELVRVQFNKGVSLSSVRLAMLADTNVNKVSLIVRGGGQSQSVAVTGKTVDLSSIDAVRKIALRYTGARGGIRLNAIRGVAAITGGGDGDGDGDGDGGGDGGGGPPVVIPLPASVWSGLALLGGLGMAYATRKHLAHRA